MYLIENYKMKYIKEFENIYNDNKPMRYEIGDYIQLKYCVVEIIHKYFVTDAYE
jgi:hypothetical protein